MFLFSKRNKFFFSTGDPFNDLVALPYSSGTTGPPKGP